MHAANHASGNQPVLSTARLVLRPFTDKDAPLLARLAGTHRVADTTASIPHPYSEEQALLDIQKFNEQFRAGVGAYFAIALRETPPILIGCVLLKQIDRGDEQAELGYWIDAAESGKGYVTEAARAVLQYGFKALELNRISACHMTRNPASARVLERIGMKQEALLRQAAKKWGVFEDLLVWAILRDEFR